MYMYVLLRHTTGRTPLHAAPGFMSLSIRLKFATFDLILSMCCLSSCSVGEQTESSKRALLVVEIEIKLSAVIR